MVNHGKFRDFSLTQRAKFRAIRARFLTMLRNFLIFAALFQFQTLND